VYSDLSFITLQYVVGTLARKLSYVSESDLLPSCNYPGEGACAHSAVGSAFRSLTPATSTGLQLTCYFEAYVRKYVFEAVGMNVTGYLPPKSRWANAAPTWDDTYYRHRTIQGQVSDENSYALGGIAGHAGVFRYVCAGMRLVLWLVLWLVLCWMLPCLLPQWLTMRVGCAFVSTAPQLLMLMQKLMFAPETSSFINATTVKLFTTCYNVTQSSRALGWDTNNYKMNTYVCVRLRHFVVSVDGV